MVTLEGVQNSQEEYNGYVTYKLQNIKFLYFDMILILQN